MPVHTRASAGPATLGRHPSRRLFACYLTAVAATPFPGSYWTLTLLSGLSLLQAALSAGRLTVSRSLIVVLAWSGLSVTWSVAPSLTVRNGALIGLMTVATAVMVSALGAPHSLRALLTACRAILVASWVLYLFAPSVGRTQEVYQAGTLEGVFVQRNVAAFFCVVAVISFLTAATGRVKGVHSGRAYLWAAAAVATLMATSSSTGLAVLLASLGVLAVLVLASRARTVSRRRSLAVSAVLPVIGLALWLPHNLGLVSELFGRDATLTGRSVIWAVVEDAVILAPWGGYGYGALWTAGVPLTDRMWAQAGFAFYHAHSAYWDYLAQIGLVGLGLVVLVLLSTTWRAVRQLVFRPEATATWPAGISICLLLYAIDEQSFASQFGWVLVVMAVSVTAGRGAGAGCPHVRSADRPSAVAAAVVPASTEVHRRSAAAQARRSVTTDAPADEGRIRRGRR